MEGLCKQRIRKCWGIPRLVLVPCGCWNRIPQSRGLKTTERYCRNSSLGLEVQIQVNRAMLPPQSVGENPFSPVGSL